MCLNLLTNEHLCEGHRLPKTANRFIVRKQVTGMKYSFGMRKSEWAMWTSEIEILEIKYHVRWSECWYYFALLNTMWMLILQLPEHTEGYTVNVTKNIKKILMHWGRHWRKIFKNGMEWITRSCRPDFFFSCNAFE